MTDKTEQGSAIKPTPEQGELRPCPFCGNPAERKVYDEDGNFHIGCSDPTRKCYLFDPGPYQRFETSEAITQWNTRRPALSESEPVGDCPNCGWRGGGHRIYCPMAKALPDQPAPEPADGTESDIDLAVSAEALYQELNYLDVERERRVGKVFTDGFGAMETESDVITDIQNRKREAILVALSRASKADARLQEAEKDVEDYQQMAARSVYSSEMNANGEVWTITGYGYEPKFVLVMRRYHAGILTYSKDYGKFDSPLSAYRDLAKHRPSEEQG